MKTVADQFAETLGDGRHEARTGTAATRWLVCCGNRYSLALPKLTATNSVSLASAELLAKMNRSL